MAAQQIPTALQIEISHVAFPEPELHSVRCAVCRNSILFLEDLMSHREGPLAGLPLCPRDYAVAAAAILHTPDGRHSVVVVG